MRLTFTEEVEALTAENASNYLIGGASVLKAPSSKAAIDRFCWRLPSSLEDGVSCI